VSNAPAIEILGLVKHYRRGSETIKALDDVDLSVSAGEMAAVVGPSGSGKTTLMNIIGCLDTPTAGSARIAGVELAGLDEAALVNVRRREVGFIFQRFYLIPTLTAAENVALPAMFDGGNGAGVDEALRKTGLTGKGRLRIGNLAGGDKQRVAIARALAKDPAVLLADEPTGRLEAAVRDEIFALFRELADDGVAIVVATHDLEAASRCDRTVYLQDGKIVSREESWLFADGA
jgi:ABC-type lipoprotein export system ATPase subunit